MHKKGKKCKNYKNSCTISTQTSPDSKGKSGESIDWDQKNGVCPTKKNDKKMKFWSFYRFKNVYFDILILAGWKFKALYIVF